MLSLKAMLYVLTTAFLITMGFWELRIKRELTKEVLSKEERPSDIGLLNDLSKSLDRERGLNDLPRELLHKYRTVVAFKFFFLVSLVVEVIVLQR